MHDNKITHTIARGIKKQNKDKSEIQQNKIQALDPLFSIPLILDRVEQAFLVIKNAWSAQNMASARAFMTDGIYERYAIQFEIQKKHQRKKSLKHLNIDHCELVGIEADKHFETLHFKISSTARHLTQSTQSASRQQPPIKLPTKKESVEYWTYVRLPGVQTRTKPGLIEGVCPNCGSPLHLSQFDQCSACHSVVSSGEYDWILAKITQESQWRFQNSKKHIKGVAEYQVVDPSFNISLIEDRVCVVFWRLQKAWLMQNISALSSIAHPDYLHYFSQHELNNFYFDDIVLELAEVSSVEFADGGGGNYDRVNILVKWQGKKTAHHLGKILTIDAIEDKNNPLNNQLVNHYAHHITMVRKSGVTSDIKKGFHSLHCFSCGAPQTNSLSEQCDYCHTQLNNGEQNWVLMECKPHINHIVKLNGKSFSIEPNVTGIRGRVYDPIALLSSVVMVLLADGKIDDKEQTMLDGYVKKRRIPKKVYDEIMQAGLNNQLTLNFPDEVLDATAWLMILIEMSLIDGEISQEEEKLLRLFGEKFNMLPIDVNLRIKKVRNKLYQAAKLALRQQEIMHDIENNSL